MHLYVLVCAFAFMYNYTIAIEYKSLFLYQGMCMPTCVHIQVCAPGSCMHHVNIDPRVCLVRRVLEKAVSVGGASTSTIDRVATRARPRH